ncbi:MAG: hypothetical protein H6721_07095 [Sandaracinus sp.]|nr:hypothetical protein [Myxococcales bacterium]MCB9612646.1 hypothetical protein [Sandaracinus sp.]MCB9631886.1 hypothetical protein [Sandaracinus sp.]
MSDAGADANDSASPLDAGADVVECEQCGGDACVDLRNDVENCGACGVACAEGWSCSDGECLDVPVEIVAGGFTTCTRMSSGDAYCWGSNTNGVAGVDSVDDVVWLPSRVVGLDRVVDIDSSGAASCAVEATGLAYCWGTNADGQLGQPADTLPGTAVPRRVQGLTGATRIAVGLRHSCAILEGGGVSCWGANDAGQLGIGSREPASGVQTVLTIDDAIDVEAGGDTTCVRRLGGGVWCWGALRADGETGGVTSPTEALGLDAATSLSGGSLNFCAGVQSGGVFCWGIYGTLLENPDGPALAATTAPTQVPGSAETRIASIAVGGLYNRITPAFAQHACFVDTMGATSCWGTNANGELGRGTGDPQPLPVTLEFDPLDEVAAGDRHTCGRTNGVVFCWGIASTLGLGESADDARTPTPLGFFPIRR